MTGRTKSKQIALDYTALVALSTKFDRGVQEKRVEMSAEKEKIESRIREDVEKGIVTSIATEMSKVAPFTSFESSESQMLTFIELNGYSSKHLVLGRNAYGVFSHKERDMSGIFSEDGRMTIGKSSLPNDWRKDENTLMLRMRALEGVGLIDCLAFIAEQRDQYRFERTGDIYLLLTPLGDKLARILLLNEAVRKSHLPTAASNPD